MNITTWPHRTSVVDLAAVGTGRGTLMRATTCLLGDGGAPLDRAIADAAHPTVWKRPRFLTRAGVSTRFGTWPDGRQVPIVEIDKSDDAYAAFFDTLRGRSPNRFTFGAPGMANMLAVKAAR